MEENQKKNSMNPMMLIAGVVILIVVAGGGYYYMNQNTSTSTESSSESMEGDAMMEEGVVTVEVEGGNFYFDPNEITVNEGDTVKISFTNAGGVHDFILDEFDVATEQTNGGDTVEVEFVADAAGEYEYYCSVGNHREQGMWGTLIVQ